MKVINKDQFNQIKTIMSGSQFKQFAYDLKTFNLDTEISINEKLLDRRMLSLQDGTMAENLIQIYLSNSQVNTIGEIIN